MFYNDKTDEPRWGNVGCGILVLIVFLGVAGFVAHMVGAASSVASAPARVLERTMTTQNIIDSYEDFRDTAQAYNARLAQIKDFSKQHALDKDDAMQLRVEIAGQRQSCRELAAHYNAQASKTNHNIFKNPPIVGGPVLPDALDMGACDAT